MAAIAYLLVYLFAGMMIVRCLLPEKQPLIRGYLGLCLGLVLLMWLPALVAFAASFSVSGHLIAMLPLAALCAAAFFFRSRTPEKHWSREDARFGRMLLFVALPLTALGTYLLFTHVIEPQSDGSLNVGQSTYGDLNLHLSIITSLRNAKFPADYAIYPGERLAYPFLTDSLSTTMMLFGLPLRAAVIVPSVLMLALVFSGYMVFCARVADTRGGAVLAALLFFLNGGLGFVYMLDMQNVALGTEEFMQLQASDSLLGRLWDMMNGFYKTPVNHSEFTTYNLRWSNVIADMLIPQRTTMGGWCLLLPCLYLLYDFAWPQADRLENKPKSIRPLILLGVMAGALPMIHTHSYFALVLISFGFFAYNMLHAKRGEALERFLPWLIYGGIAALVSVPQLIFWTFGQMSASDSFITFKFNWVNNLNGEGLQDGYFWFYLKNVGLPFVLILLSLFEKNRKRRFLASGAFVVFVLAEFIIFQPNDYDNNKLFYVWYMLCAILAADYAVALFARMKGLRSRYAIAALCVFIFFCSGTLSIARECVSDYRLFDAEEVAAGKYIEENTPEHAMIMTYTEHVNPVSSLAGRRIVCGPGIWLSYHGIDITSRTYEIMRFYADPSGNMDILRKYDIQYVYISSYERAGMMVNYAAFERDFDLVFSSDSGAVQIYRVRE